MSKHKILKNKRGVLGIPSLDGIASSIGSFINAIMDVIPAPIKFLIFLFLLVALSYMLSLIFQASGVFCNSVNEPVKTSTNIFTNLALIGETPNVDILGKEVIGDAENFQGGVEECIIFIKNGYITYSDGTNETLFNRYVYKDQGCISCIKTGYVYEERAGLDINGKYCIDSYVFPKPESEKNWIESKTCGARWFGRCQPPVYYAYNPTENAYVCQSNACVGRTAGVIWDEQLASAGANLLYTTPTNGERDQSANSLVGITCQELKPRLGVYGVDLFSFNVWILITVITLLFWAWKTVAG